MDNLNTLEQFGAKVINQTDILEFCEHKFNDILSFSSFLLTIQYIFVTLRPCSRQEAQYIVDIKKRYARLADRNVRNFYSTQGKCNGSPIAWTGYISRTRVFSQPLSEEIISVPRFCI